MKMEKGHGQGSSCRKRKAKKAMWLADIFALMGWLAVAFSKAKVDEDKGFVLVLQRLRGENTDISQEVADIEVTHFKGFMMFFRITWKTLNCNKKEILRLVSEEVGIGLMGLQQICGAQGVSFYASSIFSMADSDNWFGLGVLLMDRLGRQPLLIASAVGMCFGCLLLGMSFLFQDLRFWNDAAPTLIFPMNIKASAGSLGNLVCWSGSWMITYTFNFMMEWNKPGGFFKFAGTCGLTALFAMKLVPETKGRTLEEIQISMTKSSVDYVI
ncbi:Major facilitator, sugar transporter-like [Dillenia turbinata]|uniref:Major facilitator, sugar transporter-like n=1 Tax=Dillenia turbinata TaxID=194707 RepID=A0AAN8UEX9_9MAGN